MTAPRPTMSSYRDHPFLTACLLALGLVGLTLAVEGLTHGGWMYRAAALGIGLLFAAPGLLALGLKEAFFRRSKRLALAVTCAAATCLAAELLVRAFGPRTFQAPRLQRDDVLGHRFVGNLGEPDAWGFRNVEVPARADVVCLGDSQTWGFDIDRVDSWPHLLAASTGQTVYSMGVPGYGPLQYLALTDRALSLEPRAIVIGFYLENDAINAHTLATLEAHAMWRDPALSYTEDPSALQMQSKPAANWALAGLEAFMRHSRLGWRAVYQAKQRLRLNRHLAELYWKEPDAPRYGRAPLATYFKPEYSCSLMDLSLPHVRDGLRITRGALREIARRSASRGVQVVLLLIPTKETCYAELCQRRGEATPAGLERVATLEAAMREEVARLAAELDWTVVDPRPALVEALVHDRMPWPASADSHYVRAGNAVMVEALRAAWPGA